jgi:hypothetical protein|eukprot:4601367-Prymnesium_polylepis.2
MLLDAQSIERGRFRTCVGALGSGGGQPRIAVANGVFTLVLCVKVILEQVERNGRWRDEDDKEHGLVPARGAMRGKA